MCPGLSMPKAKSSASSGRCLWPPVQMIWSLWSPSRPQTSYCAYDGGKRFTAQTLMELIKKAHVAGKHYEWNVTDPEVHIACNLRG